MRFTIDLLRSSYYDLKRRAAAVVDGVTWQEYGDSRRRKGRRKGR